MGAVTASPILPPSSQIVGNIGMFHACLELSKRGWNVMPTSRNARGIDIIAYNDTGDAFISVQTKALRGKRNAVPLGSHLNNLMGDYWVVVSEAGQPSQTTFILSPAEVRSLATRNVKNGKESHWLEWKDYSAEHFREAWHKIPMTGV